MGILDDNLDSEFRNSNAYRSAMAFLFGRIDYERVPKMPYSQRDLNLSRMHRLLELLGNPHRQLKIIHVAGTKGKGSASAFLNSALLAAGLRCGTYTSPHLHHVEERFSANGKFCSPQQLSEIIEAVRPAVLQLDDEVEDMGPTYFEITTAVAMLFFLRQRLDIAILEVGLGGRLDSTNVCEPIASVITSISFDHTKQLGNTLALIAAEKAGIIKPKIPIISGATDTEAKQTIAGIADQRNAPFLQLGDDFSFANYRHAKLGDLLATADFAMHGPSREPAHGPAHQPHFNNLRLGLLGRHQTANAAVALATLWQLPEQLRPDEPAIREGFANTRCAARIEVIQEKPLTIVDAAHNVASAQALTDTLQETFPDHRKRLVLATTRGKDVSGILQTLVPTFDQIVITRYQNNPRGYDAKKLHALAIATVDQLQLDVDKASISIAETPDAAWRQVSSKCGDQELICISGSFFIAAELRELVLRNAV